MRNIFCYNSDDFSLGRKAKTSLEGTTNRHTPTHIAFVSVNDVLTQRHYMDN